MAEIFILIALWWFATGLSLGAYLEARSWRAKGDHEYINRKASGGRLYVVKRDSMEKAA